MQNCKVVSTLLVLCSLFLPVALASEYPTERGTTGVSIALGVVRSNSDNQVSPAWNRPHPPVTILRRKCEGILTASARRGNAVSAYATLALVPMHTNGVPRIFLPLCFFGPLRESVSQAIILGNVVIVSYHGVIVWSSGTEQTAQCPTLPRTATGGAKESL